MHADYVRTKDEAKSRAKDAADKDPFPEVPAALLSSEHIQAYVRQTAMLFPFHPDEGALKAASYEIKPGGFFVRWDEDTKHVEKVEDCEELVLPPNSISFVQLESFIRLPHYIAMRFNLRIKHVHRGLLLGTGPLVDPGFHGNLVIPLHNLTSAEYKIRKDEGLIWMEFTKTSSHLFRREEGSVGAIHDDFKPIDPIKTDRPIEYYFEASNQNRPIQSSIPKAMRDTKEEAAKAAKEAEAARKANQFFAGLGLLAVLSLVVSLYSFIQTADNNQRTSELKALSADTKAGQALDGVKGLSAQDLGHRLNDAERQISYLRFELEKLKGATPPLK